jgi:hypothetical protein
LCGDNMHDKLSDCYVGVICITKPSNNHVGVIHMTKPSYCYARAKG